MTDTYTQQMTTLVRQAVDGYRAKHPDWPHGPVRAALIDMDGTLYDSMPLHATAWKRLADELGLKTERDEFFMFEGMTGAATLRVLFDRAYGHHPSDEEIAELYHRKTLYFNEMVGMVENGHIVEGRTPTTPVMPGAREMVATLRRLGVDTVLVTGSGQLSLLERLNEVYDNAFPADKRVTSHDVHHGKPDPEPYLLGLQKAGVEPWQAIVIENAPLGVESGARAGIFTIAVTTGPIPATAMADAGADLILPSMPELAPILPQLLTALNS